MGFLDSALAIAAPVAGYAIGGPVGGMIGAQIGGSMMQGNAAKKAAETAANAQIAAGNTAAASQIQAAQLASDSQLKAAQMAADAAKFRPVGITNTFGNSRFTFDDKGYLTGAGYTLSPELKAMQDQIMGYTRQGLADTGQLQGLARGYLATTPQEAATQYLQQQQGLLQPARDVELSKIRQNLFNTGRGGLSISQGGTLGATNPEMQAYYNAIAQQDAQLAAQADAYGRERTNYGLGLLSGSYTPFQTGLGMASSIEQLGQQPLDIGAQLGGRTATAGANVGQALLSGGTNAANSMLTGATNATNAIRAGTLGAAQTMQPVNAYSPMGSALSGLSSNPQAMNALGSWFGGYGGTPQGAYGQQAAYMAQVPYSSTQQAQMLNAQTAGMFD